MRVILAHKFFYNFGGAELFVQETAKALQKSGHKVAFFSTKSEQNIPSEFEKYFVKQHDFKKGSFLSKLNQFKNVLHNDQAEENFEKLINDFKPDIINVFGFYGHLSPSIILKARELKIPVVFTCNDYKHICTNYKLYHHGKICVDCKTGGPKMAVINKCCHDSISMSVASAIEAYYYKYQNIYDSELSHLNFASNFMASMTKEFWPNAKAGFSVVRNPFDVSKYLTLEPQSAENYFLYFGRLVEEKGVDQLLKAFKKLGNSYKLKIIGNGDQEEALRRYAELSNLQNVEFLGPMWGDELSELIKKCLAVCVPSRWHENYPYVVCEAFAHRKPVLGSNRGGIPEMVEHEKSGFLFEPENVEEICDYLVKASKSSSKLVEMGDAGFEWVKKNLSHETFSRDLLESYKKVIV